ncbi:iron uptake transporter permease EfeU [Cellulomonas taurus]|uniref:iron uptake transporter permease EfeU n=1 Tax=Cellulomonas taurus TaxID=2729175 RepID=UPI00145D20D0|nr:iron uptake transporter permease EfeU [Cellulomonas taurus]
MIANVLIGLREGLEASLVVGILLAYLVRTGRRDLVPMLWAGVGTAVVVSLGFGAVLTFGPKGLTFEAQEAIGGSLSLVAAGLLTWMILWMSRTARHLKADLEGKLDQALIAGRRAVFVVALLAVGREGLETALFLWAGAQASATVAGPLIGALIGIAIAVVLGWAVYRGAVRLNLGVFFSWTGALLVVVAAGVVAYGVHDLQEAGILPGLGAIAYDISAIVPPSSWYGTLLAGLFTFSPAPTWLEVGAWCAYLVPVGVLYVRQVWGPGTRRPAPTPRVTAPAA